jgi:hypothetical protein
MKEIRRVGNRLDIFTLRQYTGGALVFVQLETAQFCRHFAPILYATTGFVELPRRKNSCN